MTPMFDPETLEGAKRLNEKVEGEIRSFKAYGMFKDRLVNRTSSGIPLQTWYSPTDIQRTDYKRIGVPGEYPYTRGIYPAQYQVVSWMNQQVHGYGLPEDTRERMMLLKKEGMTGYLGQDAFNIVFDHPTQAGLDPDHPLAFGKVGQCGVSACKVGDLDLLFQGLNLEKTNVSFITGHPWAMLAMYIVHAERRGIPMENLRGNTMNFEYHSFFCDTLWASPAVLLKLDVEVIKYCTRHMPKWNTTNLCGYDIREAGANAVQELAFTLATGIGYTEACIEAGLNPDDFLPRFGFQMAIHNDLFEDIAKLRALRRMWATINRERFGCRNSRALQARMHVHTCGSTLTAQQPLNNVARVALHTLAAVLGGTNSLMTSAYDEALGTPTEEAATLALRTQQIILHESNLPKVTDPLGGSYYVEWLTDKIEEEAYKILDEIDRRGGFLKCWREGWFRREIEKEAYKWREEIDQRKRIVVGLNKYAKGEKVPVPVFRIDPKVERTAVERARQFRASRDNAKVRTALERLKEATEKFEKEGAELMPAVMDAVRADATLGEVCSVIMGGVFPGYFDKPYFAETYPLPRPG